MNRLWFSLALLAVSLPWLTGCYSKSKPGPTAAAPTASKGNNVPSPELKPKDPRSESIDRPKAAQKDKPGSSEATSAKQPASEQPASEQPAEKSLDAPQPSTEQSPSEPRAETQPVPAGTMQPTSPPASWTSQRLIVMGNGGPRFFKFDVNVGGVDLDQGFASSMAELAKLLELNFEEPMDWNSLLDKPLVSSGWLGNLVPASDQREQLKQLYDTNKNDKVDEIEFRAFITRGLSRTAFLKLSSRASTAPQVNSTSAWGPLDSNSDGELSKDEMSNVASSLLRYDFDADRIITQSELRSADDNGSNMTKRGTSFLEVTPVRAWDLDKPGAMVNAVFESYSISDGLSKELLFAWRDDKLKQLDSSADSTISTSELNQATDAILDGAFQVSFSNNLSASSQKLKVNYQSLDPLSGAQWLSHPAGGRLTLDGCIVTIVLNDEQSDARRDSFMMQFERLAKDVQFRSMAIQVLQLQAGALEVVENQAKEMSATAADLAWQWLMAPRHYQVQLMWSASESPWFELIDLNGDQKIVVAELDQFAAQAARWDHNKDGAIAYDEMPISVLLEVRRPDVRGISSRLGGSAAEKRGANEGSAPTWFAGMDYNSDGELTKGEFLGEASDFEKFDKDQNGIIEAREVTTPQ